ncbi:hypothetical protein FHT44_005194 [Mycolicibacterium sp. BK634]|nr:hypothetical protein [Mycolicibacterium sp. BK634]
MSKAETWKCIYCDRWIIFSTIRAMYVHSDNGEADCGTKAYPVR